MENYDELCPKFLLNPHINPINNLPIADEEFDYYRETCKYLGYEFPPGKTLELMYNNKYYGMKICRDFIEDNTINPVTGEKIYPGSEDYNGLIQLCDYYKFDTTSLGEIKSVKLKTKRKSYLGELPSELEQKLELLPIPKEKLLPIPKTRLSPVPKGALSPIPNRIKPEEKNILTDLKAIARELHRDAKVKKVVIDSLSTILEKNAIYDKKSNSYVLSGSKNKYGIKQFILDLLINNELDLIMKILRFFKLKYIDIAEFLFDFPKYATNENLIFNYFINADPDTDWVLLENILENVYSNWVVDDKLNLMILLLNSAVAVGNEFISEILISIFQSWREGIQEEIDEIEDFEEKDAIINQVEILDTLSIR